MEKNNQNNQNNQKVKYIHRTIKYWTGKEIVVDIVNRKFEEIDRVWYDELEIPRGRAENVKEHTKLYRMSIDYFMAHAEIVDEER